jgi:crotonobetainyl-CoA:carnitine CoA-transferase CaiB-like acyl-CoA transferase
MGGSLEGCLVLSLEQAVAAPYCAARLADAGARVIKVERREGDFARFYDRAVGELSSYFVWLNRGKESLVADIKTAADQRLLHSILKRADVFIQNLAPGAAARAGFGSDELAKRYPTLITVDITGYGATAQYADMKAYDLLIQAESGLAAISGHPAGPGRVGVSVCDIACGMSAYAAVLEALLERQRTGRGQQLKASLFDSVADWMNVPLLQYRATGSSPQRVGLAHPTICPYGAFLTADGTTLLIAVQNEREWAQFCAHVMNEPDLAWKEGFDSNVSRVANRARVDGRIAERLAGLSREQASARLRAGGTAYGCVNDIESFARHPALRTVEIATPQGPAMLAAPPVLSSTAARPLGPVPALGQHSATIRTEFGQSRHGESN